MIPPDNAPCRHDAGLVNAPLLSAVCDHGVGRHMPPGLLMVGGALRGRVAVTRFDAARDHLPAADIVRRVDAWGADVVARLKARCEEMTQQLPAAAPGRLAPAGP
jgi:hypothetical protein